MIKNMLAVLLIVVGTMVLASYGVKALYAVASYQLNHASIVTR